MLTFTIMLHNRHINNLRTHCDNKATHALANTLKAHPNTQCFTLINVGIHNDQSPNNIVSSWLLPCTCYVPKCNYPTCLHSDIPCPIGVPLYAKSPFTPNPNTKFQILEFIYYNDSFLEAATAYKLDK